MVMKNIFGIMNDYIFLLAKTNSNEETKMAQAPKQVTLGPYKALNQDDRGIRDATAYGGGYPSPNPKKEEDPSDKRTRSQHNIVTKGKKAGNNKISTSQEEILDNKVYKVVLSKLNEYKDSNGKFNGIIRIIDCDMLRACYSLIKSNPGNMTPAMVNETLDGISTTWFNKIAKDIIEGRYKFTPARQQLIPKPHKAGEYRQLLIGNLREKIVQKALQVLLTSIFEPHFSKNSFGFLPGLSLVDALDKIHAHPFGREREGDKG